MVRKTLDGYPKNDGYTLKKVRVRLENRVSVGSIYVGILGGVYTFIEVADFSPLHFRRTIRQRRYRRRFKHW